MLKWRILEGTLVLAALWEEMTSQCRDRQNPDEGGAEVALLKSERPSLRE